VQRLHEHGLVHRDIKPANTVLCAAGDVRLIDFELAVARGTACDSAAGSWLFVSGAALCASRVSPSHDLHSVGLVLVHLVCGRLPWTTESRSPHMWSEDKCAVHHLLQNEAVSVSLGSFITNLLDHLDTPEKRSRRPTLVCAPT
jgi:serine/threonine protein kinase